MAEDSNENFWRFVTALRSDDTLASLDAVETQPYSEADHEQLASLAVEVAAGMVSPLQLSALRLSLAVRSFAPLVETHRSLAAVSAGICGGNGGGAWAVAVPSGRVACDITELAAAVGEGEWPAEKTLAPVGTEISSGSR